MNGGKLWDCVELEMRVLPALAHVELAGLRIDADKWREVIVGEEKKAEELREEAIEVFGSAILSIREPIIQAHKQKIDKYRSNRKAYEEGLKHIWEAEYKEKGTKWGDYKRDGMRKWKEENGPCPPAPKPLLIDIGSRIQLLDAFRYWGYELENLGKDQLERLAGEGVSQAELILKLRKSEKIVQAYGETLLAEIDPITNRLHFSYNQLVSTSRMSASRIQQIPSRGIGAELRKCFVPGEGRKFCVADFSNQELRILADITGAKQLLDFFAREVDVHSETARMMFNLSEKVDVKHEIFKGDITYRQVAKTINFGLIYGMSPGGLAREIGVSKGEAVELMENYFRLYPEVKKWMKKESEAALKNLRVRTQGGWERTFDELPPMPNRSQPYELRKEMMDQRRQAVERIKRQGPNTQIQGLGAAMTKMALSLFYEQVVSEVEGIEVVAVIHDEILIEAVKEKAGWAAERLTDCMDMGCRFYLEKVHVPRNEVIISDYWIKE